MKTVILNVLCVVLAVTVYGQETKFDQWDKEHPSMSEQQPIRLNWINHSLATDRGFRFDYYRDTINQMDDAHASIVVRLSPTPDSLAAIRVRLAIRKGLGEKYLNYWYTINFVDFDCPRKRMRILFSRDYNVKNEIIGESLPLEPIDKWVAIDAQLEPEKSEHQELLKLCCGK